MIIFEDFKIKQKERKERLDALIDSVGSTNKESEQERAKRLLDSIDIELIEEYVRGKKLQRIRNNMKNK